MPHDRLRHIESTILSHLKWSPAVGLYGLRQVGKTTLAKKIVSKLKGTYASFDTSAVLKASEEAPESFLTRKGLFCVDEAQKGPWIFPVIKSLVGTARAPGRFLLTGSIRFTLKKEIRESLTGRILMQEILPFSVAEANESSPSQYLQNVFSCLNRPLRKLDLGLAALVKPRFSTPVLSRHIQTGGMPIPCFTRDAAKRAHWLEAYFETLILRDIALADPGLARISYRQGMAFLRELSRMQGQELNVSRLAKAAVLSQAMARRFVSALDALALIDLIAPAGGAKKAHSKLRVEWKDVALWNHFSLLLPQAIVTDLTAAQIFMAQEWRHQISLMTHKLDWTYFKTRDGSDIPWILRQGRVTLAILWSPLETPGPMAIRSLKQFVKNTPGSFGLVLGAEKTPFLPLADKIWLMPYAVIF